MGHAFVYPLGTCCFALLGMERCGLFVSERPFKATIMSLSEILCARQLNIFVREAGLKRSGNRIAKSCIAAALNSRAGFLIRS